MVYTTLIIAKNSASFPIKYTTTTTTVSLESLVAVQQPRNGRNEAIFQQQCRRAANRLVCSVNNSGSDLLLFQKRAS